MGQNKALMPFIDRPLIQRVIDRVASAADSVCIISNEPDLYKFTARPVYPDIYIGSGALGGLAAALHYSITPFLAVVACDMPFVSSPLLKKELELLEGGGYDVIIPCSEDGEQPFHAVYRRDTCLGVVKDALGSGMLRMNSWYSRVNAHWMEWESVHKVDSNGYAFLNLNTPDDFFAAENIVKMGGGKVGC